MSVRLSGLDNDKRQRKGEPSADVVGANRTSKQGDKALLFRKEALEKVTLEKQRVIVIGFCVLIDVLLYKFQNLNACSALRESVE
jgi:hypothetical protein